MLLKLFISFSKIGLFTFGGGYAMLPLIEKELVEKQKWITQDELLEMFVISQMTPGTIAINASTFIGNKKAGKLGGLVASLGIIFPSLVIITLIFNFLGNSFENPIIHSIFSGIRACIVALIGNSVFKICKNNFKLGVSYLLFFLAFIGLLVFHMNPILLIVLGITTGLCLPLFIPKKMKQILEVK